MILPGAGYALLGDGQSAWRTLLLTLAALAAMIAVCFWPSAITLTLMVALAAVGLFAWSRELRSIKTCVARDATASILNRWFSIVALATYLFAAWVLMLAATSFGALQVSKDSAIVNLNTGSKVLFNRHLQTDKLRAGALIAFHGETHDDDRDLDIGRILAAPGDQLRIDEMKNEYLVNDRPAGAVAESIDSYAVPAIPTSGNAWTLPDDLYLVVLEPNDSSAPRRVAQLRRQAIVSHRLWRIAPGMPVRLD